MRTIPPLALFILLASLLVSAPVPATAEPADAPFWVFVRREIRQYMPYDDAHSFAIFSLISGFAQPGTQFSITLQRADSLTIQRTAQADQGGEFRVSLDHAILAGDTLTVTNGVITRTIDVPELTAQVDIVNQRVSGIAPPNLTIGNLGQVNSLAVTFQEHTVETVTDANGAFTLTWGTPPIQPSTIGSLRYVTPDGDHIYQPIWVAEPRARGVIGDSWADVVLGQPDFATISPNTVSANRLFNPAGVYVDRTTTPNRVYVFDGGNSRILGMRALGVVADGPHAGQPCTSDSDFAGAHCTIDPQRNADIVIGQPDFQRAACNGDSGYQEYPHVPPASAASLCGMRAEQTSILEGGAGAVLDTDAAGNLYVPDYFNHRILRYDDPFETDSVADAVWGQVDFRGHTCNRGRGPERPDAESLCLAPVPGFGYLVAGVDIDPAGNLWVTDSLNHRVLRFPHDPARNLPALRADLVLGQPDMTSALSGSGSAEMNQPTAVRIDAQGRVFVTDTLNHRVLVFAPPFVDGMAATQVISAGIKTPAGLEIAPDGSVWVNSTGNYHLLRLVDGKVQDTVFYHNVGGGIGIDRDNNVMVASWDFEAQQGVRFIAPDYDGYWLFLASPPDNVYTPNATTLRELDRAYGMEIAAGQLIASDGGRIMFWDRPWRASSGQAADGVVGASSTTSRPSRFENYGRMRADTHNQLWVIFTNLSDTWLVAYQLPLSNLAPPLRELRSPLPLAGGGTFSWSQALSIGGMVMQPDCDCMWLSDRGANRVFRIRDLNSNPTVDMVLGQNNISGMACNHGRDADDSWPLQPDATSLCAPGALAFDRAGNLLVADGNLEFHGNQRMLLFAADTLPARPAQAVFGIAASAVIGREGDLTQAPCPPREYDPLCGPFEPVFLDDGRAIMPMSDIVGLDFALIYDWNANPPRPIGSLGDYHSMPTSARLDPFGNVYIVDHNRTRVMIYWYQPIRTYTIQGQILNRSGKPVAGVTVRTQGFAAAAVTDAQGRYTLTDLPPGAYTLTVDDATGIFEPANQPITLSANTDDINFTQLPPDIFLPLIVR